MGTSRRGTPLSVHLFTAGLAGLAVACAAATGRGLSAPNWVLAPLVATLIAAGMLQLEYRWNGQRYALDLFEAALVPLIAVFAGPGAIVVAAATKFVTQRLLRIQAVKAVFNTAMWGAAAGIASVVYEAIRGAAAIHLIGLSAAVATTVLVSHLSVSIVIGLAQRGGPRDILRVLAPTLMPGSLLSAGVNVALGLLYAGTAVTMPELSVVFVVPLLMCGWAQRAYAEVVLDRTRIQALQEATHALVGDPDVYATLPVVLEAVRAAFASSAVVLLDRDGGVVARAGAEDALSAAAIFASRPSSRASARVVVDDGSADATRLRVAGHRNAIYAALMDDDRRLGTLVSIDRTGLDGFDDGELAVFEALAAEIAGALVRAELNAVVALERTHLREIVEGSSDGIFTVTTSGVIDDWNPAMAEITGFPADEAKGGRAVAVLRPKTVDGAQVALDEWASNPRSELPAEIVVLTRDGASRTLACSFSETTRAGHTLVVVARDVTRQREVDQLRDDFVATVSHELRTPLTSIVGFTAMLLEPPRPLTPQEHDDAIAMIRKGARRLERLVFNLLEVARIENRPVPSAGPIDLSEACESAIAEVRETWPSRSISVSLGSGAVRAVGNQLSVEQILTNLIANALKYSERGPVDIRVEEAPDSLTISVTDQGPGIPSSEHERIFERFHRVDHHHVQAGTGLGLYISRQLAVAMGGSLTVTSEPGRGSTFKLTLPAQLHLVAVS